MLSYCLKQKTNTESKCMGVPRTSNGSTMLLSKCAVGTYKKIKTCQRAINK